MVQLAPIISAPYTELDLAGSLGRGAQAGILMDKRAKDKTAQEALPGLLQQYKSGDQGALLQIAQQSPEMAQSIMQMEENKSQAGLRNVQIEGLRAEQAQRQMEIAKARQEAATMGFQGLQKALAGVESPADKTKIMKLYVGSVEKNGINGIRFNDPAAQKQLDLLKTEWSPDVQEYIDNSITLMTGYKPPEKPTEDIQEFEYAQKNPKFAEYQQAIKAAGGTNITVNSGESAPYAKKRDESEAEADVAMQKDLDSALTNAQAQQYTNQRMESLLNEGVKTGAGEDWKLDAKRWATALGADFNTDDAEEFRRLANTKAFDELAKFKGATSEKELAFSKRLVGDITTSNGAVRRYLAVSNRMLGRTEEMAKELLEYKEKNDGSERGFRDYWKKYQLDNPLIAQPKTDADYGALPRGGLFIDPDSGELKVKP